MRRNISASVDGGMSGGSSVCRPGSECPHLAYSFWIEPGVSRNKFKIPPLGSFDIFESFVINTQLIPGGLVLRSVIFLFGLMYT